MCVSGREQGLQDTELWLTGGEALASPEFPGPAMTDPTPQACQLSSVHPEIRTTSPTPVPLGLGILVGTPRLAQDPRPSLAATEWGNILRHLEAAGPTGTGG